MKIVVIENEKLPIDELQIHCKFENEKVKEIVKIVNINSRYFTVKRNGELLNISPIDVFYIQTTDKKTFLYTIDEVHEVSERLYQLEKDWSEAHFFRISKDTVVNLMHIKSACPQLNRNLIITLKNDEKLIMSRRYVGEFKSKLTK